MRLRSMSILAVGAALILMTPGMVVADLLLDTGSATNGQSDRDPGGLGFGQGVSVSTATNLDQIAMFLDLPGTFKHTIWNGANTTLQFFGS